jgi:diacylglycerol kinase
MINRKGFLRSRIKSIRDALSGVRFALLTQKNMWIHLVATGIVVIMGFWFGISLTEWTLLTLTISIVFVAETVNTAIEKLSDCITTDYDKNIGVVKDVAAGAVLLAAIFAVVIGLLVFIPYLCEIF